MSNKDCAICSVASREKEGSLESRDAYLQSSSPNCLRQGLTVLPRLPSNSWAHPHQIPTSKSISLAHSPWLSKAVLA